MESYCRPQAKAVRALGAGPAHPWPRRRYVQGPLGDHGALDRPERPGPVDDAAGPLERIEHCARRGRGTGGIQCVRCWTICVRTRVQPTEEHATRNRFVSESRCFLRHAPYSAELASCRELSADLACRAPGVFGSGKRPRMIARHGPWIRPGASARCDGTFTGSPPILQPACAWA